MLLCATHSDYWVWGGFAKSVLGWHAISLREFLVGRSYIGVLTLMRYRVSRERGTGNGEWGMGNGEWGTGNGEWGTGNGERGMGNGEWGMEKNYVRAIV